MGYNITGIICSEKIDTVEGFEKLLGINLKNLNEEVSFENALNSFKKENCIDTFYTEKGTFILPDFGKQYDFTKNLNIEHIIQFIVSDVSNTYYFEKLLNAKLVRKLITSDGEIHENYGSGIIEEEDYLLEIIWLETEKILGINLGSQSADKIMMKRFRF